MLYDHNKENFEFIQKSHIEKIKTGWQDEKITFCIVHVHTYSNNKVMDTWRVTNNLMNEWMNHRHVQFYRCYHIIASKTIFEIGILAIGFHYEPFSSAFVGWVSKTSLFSSSLSQRVFQRDSLSLWPWMKVSPSDSNKDPTQCCGWPYRGGGEVIWTFYQCWSRGRGGGSRWDDSGNTSWLPLTSVRTSPT